MRKGYEIEFVFRFKIEEVTVALVQERKNGAHLQQENAKLESELESKEEELSAERKRKDRTGAGLRQQVT